LDYCYTCAITIIAERKRNKKVKNPLSNNKKCFIASFRMQKGSIL